MQTLGWAGSILLALCCIPETYRTVKTGKCYVGWGMLLLWYLGEILTFLYIFPKLDLPLLVNYGINIVCISIMLWYKWNGRKI